jgi:chemotaxis protein histidine kinase CheA
MAIEKVVNIVVKETGIDQVQKQVNKLDSSLENLSDTNKGVAKSMGESSGAVLENGGAMGLLNDATGGLAMTVKDAVEASVLFTKSQKLSAMWQGVYTTVVGTSTGAMKLFRIALASTGIGLIVIGIGLLIANFDKVKKAVMTFIPGLAIVGDIFTSLVETVTDFVGITSDASRELDKLGKQAESTLAKNKFALDAYGDTYDQYTKQKIEANNKYAQHVKDINEDETLSEKQKLAKLKILRETANREIDKADQARTDERNKKAKEAQDKLDEANKTASEKAKQDKLKADEDAKKALEEKIKSDAQKAFDENEKLKEDTAAVNEFLDSEKEKKNDKEAEDSANRYARMQYDADQEKALNDKKKADKIAVEQSTNDALTLMSQNTNSLFDNLEALGLKKSKASQAIRKGLALAQIAQDTATAISNAIPMAIKAGQEAAKVSGPAAPVVGPVVTAASYAGSAAMIFSNVARAKQLLSGGGGGGGGSTGGGGGSVPSAPSFNLVQGTNSNQIAQSINTQQPIEAFVVSKNVSTGQELDRNIIKSASL